MDLRYFIGLARRSIDAGEWFTGIADANREVIPIVFM
jgi:hypothetical protein